MESKRMIVIELVSFGVVKEQITCSVQEAKELLDTKMNPGHRYRICPPCSFLDSDEKRYEEDCEALGLKNWRC